MAAYPLLIVFGAGDARSSKRYTQAAERIVAVEPRAEAAMALQDALGDRGLVVTAAAGDGQGEAVLTRYELPEYTSEHRPAGLAALFPAIKGMGSLTVDRVDAGELLADAFDVQTRTAAVIVDVNGAERAVLDSLSRAAAFDRVSRLDIRCGVDALYEGAMTAADAEDWLVGSGFCDVKVRGAGPVRTVSGERDLEALATAALSLVRQEAEAMRRERDTTRAELDIAHQKIAALQAEHGEALNAASADLGAAQTATLEAEARLEALLAQLEAAKEARARADETAARLLHEAEGARMELGSLRSNFETVRQQVIAAEDERAQLAGERDALRRELARVREEFDAEAQAHSEALSAAWTDRDAADQAREAAEAEFNRLAAELQAQMAACAQRERATRDQAGETLAAVQEKLGLLQRSLEHSEGARAVLEDRLKAVAAEAQTARSEAAQRQDDLGRRSEAELSEMREALHAVRSDLSLALHSKALAEDDLRDLRNRYAQLTEVKDRQDNLLERLSHRLGEASSVLASMPEMNVFEALTDERAPGSPDAVAKRPPAKPRVPGKKKTGKGAK